MAEWEKAQSAKHSKSHMSNFFGMSNKKNKMNLSGSNFAKGKFVKALSTGRLMIGGKAVNMKDYKNQKNSQFTSIKQQNGTRSVDSGTQTMHSYMSTLQQTGDWA